MNKIFLCLVLLNLIFSSVTGFAQNLTIEGTIISKDNKEPLPYASIEIKSLKTGTYSNEKGDFSISIPEKNHEDTMEISSLGYEKKIIRISELRIPGINKIELKNKVFSFKEVVIKPVKTKTFLIGPTDKKPWRYQVANIIGGQYGRYFVNNSRKQGIVKTVSYYIYNLGHTNTPFRVRIYSADFQNNRPGEDLLKENVIVTNNNGPGWFKVDLTKYRIQFPENGCYIMMEWIDSGDQYFYDWEATIKSKDGKSEKKELRRMYGQTLVNLIKQPDQGFWAKGLGTTWNHWNAYYKGYCNVMINAEVAIPFK
jgi:hypothetical protein